MLCSNCTDFLENPRFVSGPQANFYCLHSDVASLEYSLFQGCGFCTRLVREAEAKQSKKHNHPSQLFSSLQIRTNVDRDDFRMDCRLSLVNENKSVIRCHCSIRAKVYGHYINHDMHVYLFLAPEQAPLPDLPVDDTGTGLTPRLLSVVSSWLEKCCSDHAQCEGNRTANSGRRFARILDLGDDFNSPYVSLSPSRYLPSILKYTTLSHCWGNATDIPCLTSGTYARFLHEIVIDHLPRTFQDAIHLTRALGMRYLWIDSMCIIQDSAEDWLREALIMGEVYQSSFLNIAAAKSVNAHGGLFAPFHPVLARPLRVGFHEHLLRQIPTLELEGRTILRPATRYAESRIDLRRCLGTRNGQFDETGVHFDQSAHNVVLVGDILHADVRRPDGQWQRAYISLKLVTGLWNPQYNSQRFRLQNKTTLVIMTPVAYGPEAGLRVDLDQYLGNKDGRFASGGSNFAWSAREIEVQGTVVSALLMSGDGHWARDSIDVAPLVRDIWYNNHTAASTALKRRRYFDIGNDYFTEWGRQVDRTKLCSRGWVLQERLLAPRVIYFGEHGMCWECLEMSSLEERPEVELNRQEPIYTAKIANLKALDPLSTDLLHQPEPRSLGIDYVWSSVRALQSASQSKVCREDLARDRSLVEEAKCACYGEDNWTPTHFLIRYWAGIVGAYGATELTRGRDRLIAIAGIAKLLSTRSGMRYVAGLWAYQLPRQLLWFVKRQAYDHRIDDAEHVAPSWSWASYTRAGGIFQLTLDPGLEARGAMDLVKVLSIDIEGASEDDPMQFGSVRSGRLRLRGRLIPIALDFSTWPHPGLRRRELVPFSVGSTPKPPVGATFLLPVLFIRWNERLPLATPNSLLLEWTGQTGTFRRIGTARLSSRCPLEDVICGLSTMQDTAHQDIDNDTASEEDVGRDGSELQVPWMVELPEASLNPQQQLRRAILETTTEQLLSEVENTQRLMESAPKRSKEQDKQRHRHLSIDGTYHMQLEFDPDILHLPGKSTLKRWLGGQHRRQSTVDSSSLGKRALLPIRNSLFKRKAFKTMPPRKAIDHKYYLNYLEDEEAKRFGHFVFDII